MLVVTPLKSLMRDQVTLIKIILWVDLPCTTMIKYTLKRHETSECYNAAKMLEASLCMSREDKRDTGSVCSVNGLLIADSL